MIRDFSEITDSSPPSIFYYLKKVCVATCHLILAIACCLESAMANTPHRFLTFWPTNFLFYITVSFGIPF